MFVSLLKVNINCNTRMSYKYKYVNVYDYKSIYLLYLRDFNKRLLYISCLLK